MERKQDQTLAILEVLGVVVVALLQDQLLNLLRLEQ
jgi:hypothetical protein